MALLDIFLKVAISKMALLNICEVAISKMALLNISEVV